MADVVVVGAGPSGLACARRLLRHGVDVLVVEARPRVGGRVWSERVGPDGPALDLGAQLVGTHQHRVRSLVDAAGLALRAVHDEGDAVDEDAGGVRRVARPRPTGVAATLDAALLGARLGLLAARRRRGWLSPRTAAVLDRTTVATTLDDTARTAGGAAAWRHLVEQAVAAGADEVSVLEVVDQLVAVDGLRGLAGADRWFLPAGMGALVEHLAAPLAGRVLLDTPVRSVTVEPSSGHAVVGTDTGDVIARRVVLALPPHLAGSLVAAADRVALGLHRPWVPARVVKTLVVHDEPWWRRRGLSGRARSSTGPASEVIDTSPAPDGPGVLVVLTAGPAADRLVGDTSPHTRDRAVLSHLDGLLGAAPRPPVHVRSVAWSTQRWSRGGYAVRAAPGANAGDVGLPRAGPIVLAGTEHAPRWRSYVEGGVVAGETAGDLLVGAGRAPVDGARVP